MKSYNGLFDKMVQTENIKAAFYTASVGKRGRSDVKRALGNIDEEVEKVKSILINGTYRREKKKTHIINASNAAHKTREIAKPRYCYDQVVHHCIVSQLKPIVTHGLYEFTCGSIKGKGPHYGKKYMRKWINSYKGKKIYILKMDIHHFYQSINIRILKDKLAATIRDQRFLDFVYKVIGDEVSLGLYTSPWMANLYLKDFDHWVKQALHAERYMRYADDMVIIGRNKKELHRMRRAISEYLGEQLDLELKGDWQVSQFERTDKTGRKRGRFLDFMGFRFHQDKITLRKSILKKAARKARKIKRKGKTTWYDAVQMVSLLGWFWHTDTYGYYIRHIKPIISIKNLKKIISRHAKKEAKKHDRMDRSHRVSAYRTAGA